MKRIISFAYSKKVFLFLSAEIAMKAMLTNNPPPPEAPTPPGLPIDAYFSCTFVLAILLGFVYFKRMILKK